jgi:hypothetical protein
MSTTGTVVEHILKQRAIGAARVGGSFAEMALRYGDPTDVSDPRDNGYDERRQIWFYDEVQVWSDVCGIIDRVFSDVECENPKCLNHSFVSDMAEIREHLRVCDVEVFTEAFSRAFGNDIAEVKRRSSFSELSAVVDGLEVFAVFLASKDDGRHLLSLLRLNATAKKNRVVGDGVNAH